MRKIIYIIAIAAAALVSMTSGAQKYTVTKTGEVTTIPVKAAAAKKPDTCIKIMPDGTRIYKGAKGGIYYWRTSSKTGQLYKCYLKKAQ